MATYQDANDRKWRVELDGFLMRRIRQETGVNICDVVGRENSFATLLMDIEKTVDVLWLCCEEQAINASIDEIGFAKGLKGDALGRAVAALQDAVIDFFPSQEQRTMLRTVMTKAEEAGGKMMEKATETIAKLNIAVAATSMPSTGNLPGS